jgi:TATA-binding protein-associated factor Taf7
LDYCFIIDDIVGCFNIGMCFQEGEKKMKEQQDEEERKKAEAEKPPVTPEDDEDDDEDDEDAADKPETGEVRNYFRAGRRDAIKHVGLFVNLF